MRCKERLRINPQGARRAKSSRMCAKRHFTSEGGRAGPLLPATTGEEWSKNRNDLEPREQARRESDVGDPCESVDLVSKWEAINMASQELDAKQEKLSHMRALAADPPVNIEPIVTMVAGLASHVRSLRGFLGSHETQSDMDAVALQALCSRTSRLLARVEAIQEDLPVSDNPMALASIALAMPVRCEEIMNERGSIISDIRASYTPVETIKRNDRHHRHHHHYHH